MASGRATGEVAKHFLEKYGSAKAIEIISARISGDGAKQDTEFWLDVIQTIKMNASKVGYEASPDIHKLTDAEKPTTHS